MLHFKRSLHFFLPFLMVGVFCQPAIAYEETDKKDGPWEKAAIMGGAFITTVDSGLDIGGSGLSGTVDGEEVLGLDENPIVWRIDAFWRITKRNRLDFTYYDLSRDGEKVLQQEIDDPTNGVIDIGTRTETKFDFRLAKLTWAYAFFEDERMEIAAGLGLYMLDIDFELSVAGGVKVDDTSLTTPLPVFDLRAAFALTDKFMLRQHLGFFYLAYKDYTGNVVDLGINLDWNFWKYAGIGIGYNFMFMEASQDKDDFLSRVEMSYGGLLLYGKLYF